MYNPNDPLKVAKDALDRAIESEKRSRKILESVGPAVISSLSPLFAQLKEAISRLKVDVSPVVKVNPEIKIPPIIVPTPRYTPPDVIVNYTPPKINIPEIDLSSIRYPELMWPKGAMQIAGDVRLLGIDTSHPLPVQLRDSKGNLVDFSKMGGGGTAVFGGGGKADFFTIKDIQTSSGASIIDQTEGAVKVVGNVNIAGASGSIGAALVDSSGVQYSGSNPLPITGSISTTPGATFFASDAILSVNVIQNLGSDTPVGTGYQDNALRVVNATDAITSVNIVSDSVHPVGQGDEATALRIVQAGNSISSVSVTNTSIAVTASDLDIRDLTNVTDLVSSYQVSGHNWSVFATNPVAQGDSATALRVVVAGNSDMSVFATNPINQGDAATALRVVVAGNSDVSVTATLAASSTVNVNGALNSVLATGPVVADAVDDGSAPVQGGGVARTANPTAVANGDVVKSTHDDLGRQLVRPVQVRDLVVTAYVTVTTGIETTLLAGSAGSFHDLMYIMAANESSVAQNIDIRAVTAGNVVMSLAIPANGTAGVALPLPFPQSDTGNNWTIDNDGSDVSNTTINVSALFSREV